MIDFTPSEATGIAHGFNMLCMFMPLIGAIIADTCWGRYKTILVISLIYALGNVVISVTAIPDLGGSKGNWYGPIVGLVVIGFGTGGIKSCVSAFGGDQFDESEKGKEKSTKFFSFFYAAINAGSLISLFVTPIFKGNILCFGKPCYFLAFGVPAILMIIAVVFFVIGGLRGGYVKVPPKGSVIKDACSCINYALKRKRQNRGEKRAHWLDFADDKFSANQIADVKSVLNIFTVFAPLPLFWSLYDQQATRWVLQSERMDVRIGSWVFQPEQLQVLNPILILILIPLFDHGFYPLARKCVRDTPLRRIGAGMAFAGFAFMISGFLEYAIENSSKIEHPKADHSFVSIFNANSLPVQVKVGDGTHFHTIERSSGFTDSILTPNSLKIKWTSGVGTSQLSDTKTLRIPLEEDFDPEKNRIVVHFVPESGSGGGGGSRGGSRGGGGGGKGKSIHVFHYFSKLARPIEYKTRMSVVSTLHHELDIKHMNQLGAKKKHVPPGGSEESLKVSPGVFSLKVKNEIKEMTILNGGIYAVAVYRNGSGLNFHQQVLLKPYSLSIFLQVPQILVMAMGEIMLSITGLSFAFSQAPATMKSLLQAGWLMTIFAGNLIDVLIIASQSIKTLWIELFFFTGLMFLFLIPFTILAKRYKYVEDKEEEAKSD